MEATMFEAKTKLSDLVKRAQMGERIVLTHGRDKKPVAEIVAIQPPRERKMNLFYTPGFEIPADRPAVSVMRIEAMKPAAR